MKNKILLIFLVVMTILLLSALGLFTYKGHQSRTMMYLPSIDGPTPIICSEKPNCVSSKQDPSHPNYIAPKKLDYNPLWNLHNHIPENCKIEKDEAHYKYYICKSGLFGFVDDLEIYYDADEQLLHFKSASRVGHSDLGVNRKRIEAILKFL